MRIYEPFLAVDAFDPSAPMTKNGWKNRLYMGFVFGGFGKPSNELIEATAGLIIKGGSMVTEATKVTVCRAQGADDVALVPCLPAARCNGRVALNCRGCPKNESFR